MRSCNVSPVLDSSSSSSEESVNIRIFGEFSAGNAPVALLQTLSSHTQLRSYSSNRSHSSSTTRAELIDVLILKTYEHGTQKPTEMKINLLSQIAPTSVQTVCAPRLDSVWFCVLWSVFVGFASDFRCFFVRFWFSRCFHHNTQAKWRWCHNQPLPWRHALWPHTSWRARCIVGGVVRETHLNVNTDRDRNAFILFYFYFE